LSHNDVPGYAKNCTYRPGAKARDDFGNEGTGARGVPEYLPFSTLGEVCKSMFVVHRRV
jgi:hypothetical protein